MMKRNLYVVLAALTIGASAFAQYNLTVITSSGVLAPPGVTVSVPTWVIPNPLPQNHFSDRGKLAPHLCWGWHRVRLW
jgi:hypothetical protein